MAEYTLAAIIMAGKRVPFIARAPVRGWQDGMARGDLTTRPPPRRETFHSGLSRLKAALRRPKPL